jgi:uncharacterized membrane protein YfcA
MEILGYFAAACIGISLGLVGGGGSILTVPVLVYLFGVNPVMATSYSLFIVGTTSLVGAYGNFRKGQVNFKAALLFGSSSIFTVFVTRKFVIQRIPDVVFFAGKTPVTHNLLTMLLFAALMLMASLSMILNSNKSAGIGQDAKPRVLRAGSLLIIGVLIGLITGLLGAGGGFLLIPALVLFLNIPMKEAIGTSLFIIALNSLIGFAGDLTHFKIQWTFLFSITSIAVVGIFAGMRLSKNVKANELKKWFGIFVLVMGLGILIKELFFSS